MIEPTDDELRAWLLGRVDAASADAFEARLVADESFAQQLRAVEDDLLDDYARGSLEAADRARAADYFEATPADRRRVRMARALAETIDGSARRGVHRGRGSVVGTSSRNAARRRRVIATGFFASAGAVLVALIGVNFWPSLHAPDATIALTGGAERGATTPIAIPRSATRVRLQAEVPDGASTTHYTLSVDADGVETFHAAHLEARTTGAYRIVETTLPADALAGGAKHVRVVAEDASRAEASWAVSAQ
jgi:hypothetical protein